MSFFLYDFIMKIIVGCSGGPDSMALLDLLRKEGKDIVVAHVNYRKRESALRDERIVKEYAGQYGIIVKTLYPVYDHSSNFQAWAREVRYHFFERICDQYDTKDIYIAHQMDDLIETYFFQKQRDMLCDTYGLKEHMERNGYKIHRPLLDKTKEELEQYCITNQIPYGIDESNLTDDYTRNQIRHHQTNHLSYEQKVNLCKEINNLNQKEEKLKKEMGVFLADFKVDDLLCKEDNWRYLEYYLYSKIGKHFSKGYCIDLCVKLKKDTLIEIENYDLERFHDELTCTPQKKKVKNVYNSIAYVNQEMYKLTSTGTTIQSMTLKESDFPICIRTVQNEDEIHMRFGTKKVHRFFVDRKIPKHIRKYWLVVENKDKKVIFVPDLGCDVEHFSVKPNLFMVQCHS